MTMSLPDSVFGEIKRVMIQVIEGWESKDRRSYLAEPLQSSPAYRQIDWQGPAEPFTASLITCLGSDDLISVLEYFKRHTGAETHKLIDSLCKQVKELSTSEVIATPVSDSKLLEDYDVIVRKEFNKVLEKVSAPTSGSYSSLSFYGALENYDCPRLIPELSRVILFVDILKLIEYSNDRQQKFVRKVATCRWRALTSAIASGMKQYDKRVLLDPLVKELQSTQSELNSQHFRGYARDFIKSPLGNYAGGISHILEEIGKLGSLTGVALHDLVIEEKRRERSSGHRDGIRDDLDSLRHRYSIEMFIDDKEGSWDKVLHELHESKLNIVQSSTRMLIAKEVAKAELVVSFDGSKKEFDSKVEEILDSETLDKIVLSYELPSRH